MSLRLVCALPSPGCYGTPRGLFYEDTPAGKEMAKDFRRREGRPGWDLLECPNTFRDDVNHEQLFNELVEDAQRKYGCGGR